VFVRTADGADESKGNNGLENPFPRRGVRDLVVHKLLRPLDFLLDMRENSAL